MGHDIMDFVYSGVIIIEGYARWFWDIIRRKTSVKAERRYRICSECEHNIHNMCDVCGCLLNAKVRVDYIEDENGKSIDGCPLSKW